MLYMVLTHLSANQNSDTPWYNSLYSLILEIVWERTIVVFTVYADCLIDYDHLAEETEMLWGSL